MILYMSFEVSSGYDHRCKDTDSQTRKHPWIPFQFSAFEYSPPLRVEARAVPYAWQGHLKAGSSGAQKGGSKVKIPLDLLHVNEVCTRIPDACAVILYPDLPPT